MKQIFARIVLITLLIGMMGSIETDFAKIEAPEFSGGGVRADTIYVPDTIQLPARYNASTADFAPAYENESQFLSPILTPDFAFDVVGIEWEEVRPSGTDIEFQVRFQHQDEKWGQWNVLHPDDTKDGATSAIDEVVSTARSQAIQYKVLLRSSDSSVTPQVKNVNFHYIDGAYQPEASVKQGQSPAADLKKLSFASESYDIISREEWAADESWRTNDFFGYDPDEDAEDLDVETEDMSPGHEPTAQELYPEEFELTETITQDDEGNDLYWPQEYAKNVDKIIIHHTAGINGEDNAAASVRGIYYYHTVRKGWGDIGYNYLIDTHGNIYEGRAGGESVVAGHARGNNTGTIGIAVMGNYEEESVSYAALEALAYLVQDKAELHNINVDRYSSFRGEVTPNMGGHRDFGSTLCPGKNLYAILPVLRDIIDSNLLDYETQLIEEGSDDPYAFANVNRYDTLVMNPEDTETFTLELKNIGTEIWDDETYLVANRNTNAETLVHLTKSDGNSQSIAYINETETMPGETATFTIEAEAMMRGGFESFDITPIFSGVTKTNHYLNLPVYVASPILTYDVSSLTQDKERTLADEIITGKITIENTGNVDWMQDGSYPMSLSGITLPEEIVEPGEYATFSYDFIAPTTPGTHTEYFTPIIEGADSFEGDSIGISILVYDKSIQAQFIDASTDDQFEPGEQKDIWIDLQNVGYLTWENSGDELFNVGLIHHPDIGVTAPTLGSTTVDLGETGRVEFEITAPQTPGNYTVYLKPRVGKQNLVQKPLYFKFTVAETEAITIETTNSSITDSTLDQEEIRIKLSYDQATFDDPVITANGAFDVYRGDILFLDLAAGDEVEVRVRPDNYQVIYDAYAWVVEEVPRFVPRSENTILEITNYENRPSWNPALNDNFFRGVLEVQSVEGELTIINELPLEMYLRGIAEAINSEPTEKIRTMTILARTYARWYMSEEEKFPGMPYNLDDDPNVSQKYLGYGYEMRAPNIVQAVADTAGMVVTYEGEVIKTPYFSSTDGTSTRSAEEVWGWTFTPYLQSVSDSLCEVGYFSGHGVGLSGCGATAAAEQGSTYEEIIKYYYQGVEIEVK